MSKREASLKNAKKETIEDIPNIQIQVVIPKKHFGKTPMQDLNSHSVKGEFLIGSSEKRKFVRKIKKYNKLLKKFISEIKDKKSNLDFMD